VIFGRPPAAPGDQTPVVLAFGGHDPTGGAGILADSEAVAALGAHAATVVTCLTVQDTRDVQEVIPQSPDLVVQAARLLLADLPVRAVKIGLLGDAAVGRAIAGLLADYPDLPVVFDPVLAAGGGHDLVASGLLEAITYDLLPRVTLITPNGPEACRLTGLKGPEECAAVLQRLGCEMVLITGGHAKGNEVVNRLFLASGEMLASRWPRVAGEFHGTGCTLAAGIAAGLALGLRPTAAVARAEEMTWKAVGRARRIGRGQAIPLRGRG
jgi:hydroxymethylpyrimidine/phosphomethylpyrimidine kinase